MLIRLSEHDDHGTLWDLSVINVRLYDRQDELKTGARKKTLLKFYIIYSYMSSDCELRCTRDRNVGYHEKYMNGGNNGVFKKNSVCSSTHPHENSDAAGVYQSKGNISDEVRERRTGALEIMADRIII